MAMGKTHLRGHPNILKRLLIHVGGFNLGLMMRAIFGIGKPRRLQDGLGRLAAAVLRLLIPQIIRRIASRRPDVVSASFFGRRACQPPRAAAA